MAGLLKFAVLCLLLSVCAEVVTAQATCAVADDASLQYFCREFVYARSEFKTWIPGTNCCTWQGVTCNSNGNVVSLDIENIDQNPPYPSGPGGYFVGTGLLGLADLASLTMKNVAFNGGIPPSWGTLTAIQVMNLDSCNIVGSMPSQLCSLNQMKNFSMADNLMTGPLPGCMNTPFSTFHSLSYFNITGNDFS